MSLTSPGARVNLNRRAVQFPGVCPHCLGVADRKLAIQTKSEFAGYFVVYTRWRHWVIQVPFCRRFISKRRRAKVYLLLGFLTAAVALISNAPNQPNILLAVAAIALIALSIVPISTCRPEKYVDLINASEAGADFDVLNVDYAQALAELNGGTYYTKFQSNEAEKM